MKKRFPAIFFLFVLFSMFVLVKGQPKLTLKPQIQGIVPLYDDCQLLFSITGKFFGASKGKQEIRLDSGPFNYTAEITGWSNSKIDCRLRGNFELGRTYGVYIFDPINKTMVSNSFHWLVKTKIKVPDKTYFPGTKIAASGHLLGFKRKGRQLQIGNINAVISQWTCEDILFIVPKLRPGKYKVELKKGGQSLSNVTYLKIGKKKGFIKLKK